MEIDVCRCTQEGKLSAIADSARSKAGRAGAFDCVAMKLAGHPGGTSQTGDEAAPCLPASTATTSSSRPRPCFYGCLIQCCFITEVQ